MTKTDYTNHRPYWRDGAPTELGIEVFTQGDCWVLAYELFRMTGWPIVCIGPIEDDMDSAKHYAVRAPSGHLLDVDGVATRGVMARRWGVSSITLAGPTIYHLAKGSKRINHSEFLDSWRRAPIMARRLLDVHGVRQE